MAKGSIPRSWKLNPSDLTFLWEECRRCFYLKVVNGVTRPRTPMPKIFMRIHSEMKAALSGSRTDTIAAGIPLGVVEHGEKQVVSKPISVEGFSSTLFIRGRFDIVVKLDNGGGWGIVDFKTADLHDDHVLLYGRQLHAYTCALENPTSWGFALHPVTRLGLLVFNPTNFSNFHNVGSLTGSLNWKEVPRDDNAFRAFLTEILSVLDKGTPPDQNPSCEFCQHRGIGIWAIDRSDRLPGPRGPPWPGRRPPGPWPR